MAAPHVTGIVALMITANVSDIRGQLQITADDLGATGWDSKYGYGLVDAAKAVGVSGEEPEEPTTGTMHVSNIEMSLRTRGPWVNAIATVTIVDESGAPVEGATVSGKWSGAASDSESGTTNNKGQVTFKTDRVKNLPSGTIFTFTVDDVTKEGWTYDSGVNVETSDSITI
jgi:hypothetical protein